MKRMKTAISMFLMVSLGSTGTLHAFQGPLATDSLRFNFAAMPDVLPGTKPLGLTGDISFIILDGAHRFIEAKISAAQKKRAESWRRNFSSVHAYEESVDPNRKRLMTILGIEDKNQNSDNYNAGLPDVSPRTQMQKISLNDDPALVAETSTYKIYQVRWPVLNRVFGEGLLLQPKSRPVANIIAIPDADQTPEQLAGLSPGIKPESQFARRLVESGFQVLVPLLINRTFLFPGLEQQQTYREWIYRQAFHMGRHIIGYEVQKIMAAIDWFKASDYRDLKTGVAGYHEGGLISFYTAAVDTRVDAVLVSGYFNSREKVWDEPIYRNVWGLLSEFGDAEIATLVVPRTLVIEYSQIPETVEKITGFKDQVEGWTFTGYKGTLQTPLFKDVQFEYDRTLQMLEPKFQTAYLIRGPKNNPVSFGSGEALEKFTAFFGQKLDVEVRSESPLDLRKSFDPDERQRGQLKELEDHVQWLVRDSDEARRRFFLYEVMPQFAERKWSTKPFHAYHSPESFTEKADEYRKIFHEEVIGKFDDPLLSPDARTRKLYDRERWTGYEVVLHVYPEVLAAGILLIPKDIQPNEKRPVVVCQHGRSDIPQKLVEGNFTAYNNVAARLADEGFIVYAPYNPYRGEDRYRWLHRKANTVKKTLFSFITSQHDQALRWLGTLPFVDKKRIAFYGLSYGGQTAMRAPAVLEGYSLSICSGDFGDWTRKVADTHFVGSFMNSLEWEMPYFNMGNTFSYAEMAYLIFPRPFMVERGHHDLVQPDEWVAYEYAKVRYFYDQFNLGDKTEIEFFNGGHSMRQDGTIRFLHKHLRWP
jgi:dienelactone hydrolase